MTQRFDTVVIGAGAAGLAMSYCLTQQGSDHIVLEKRQAGEAWRSGKWDSFTLVSPNWTLRLPGFAYAGNHPDGYLTRDEVIRYLEDYSTLFHPPVRTGVAVKAVEGAQDGLVVETDSGSIEAANVVVATGAFQQPKIPACSARISPEILQLHTSQYRNPRQLPDGAVLVVGSGQSGCQIAEELYRNGRKVYLCTGKVRRVPRTYRGKDIFWWAEQMGMFDQTVDTLDSPAERFTPNPQLTGNDGGRALNLHQFALDGVTLLGRFQDTDGSRVAIAGDLMENLASGDEADVNFRKAVDKLIEETGMSAPPAEEEPELRAGYDAEIITELDLKAAGITTIIWAAGYQRDFRWIKFPIFDEFGYPVQQRGVTAQPGLYFIALQWLHTLKSSLLMGMGEDAAHIAAHIANRTALEQPEARRTPFTSH
jgi:putative flavoprotein involved in K+ transport